MPAVIRILISTLFLAVTVLAAGCQSTSCSPGSTQACLCSDGSQATQMCLTEGESWDACACTNSYQIWDDSSSNLSWQNPQKDANTPNYQGLGQVDAIRYCDELVLGGHSDWRLPDIDELRTLIRGNPSHESGGACPVVEGSNKSAMEDAACIQAPDYEGPGLGGCYWPTEILGPCNRDDLADPGERALETTSSTNPADDRFWKGDVLFDQGTAVFNHRDSYSEARCVRDGPTSVAACDTGPAEQCSPGLTRTCTAGDGTAGTQSCLADGLCYSPCENTSFIPTPPGADISDQCDQLQLTLSIPTPLPAQAKLLLAFLYSADDWSFPPQRPPDGGTDYNILADPVIDFGSPLEMTVPAVSYYRDRCIDAGQYHLFIALAQSDEWPPWPRQLGDYTWGEFETPFSLNYAEKQVITLELELDAFVPPIP